MNSTDVVRIARDVGFTYIEELEPIDFTSEILELAAKRCDKKVEMLSGIGCDGVNDRIIAAKELAQDIRDMKVKV